MIKKTEQKVADAILQRSQEVEIEGVKYQVAPPTIATLVLVSECLADLPAIKLNTDEVLSESLLIAKDCKPLGDICAIMILGAKNLVQTKKIEKKKLFGLLIKTTEVTVHRQKELAETILNSLSPNDLYKLMQKLLAGMEIADFFALTTSLTEINLTRETREVGKMTVYGR